MRKILATALAILMLAGVLLVPAMAAAEPYDHTTATDVPSLVMTEIVANSKSGIANSGRNNEDYDAFEYIEIYNRGDSAVNLYALSILRSPYCKRNTFSKENPYYTAWNTWQSSRKFLQKADIKSGNVRAEHVMDEEEKKAMGAAAVSSLKFENNLASNGALAPHKSAVLFFVTDTTIVALSQYITKNLGGSNANADLARDLFRDFYKIPEDVDIYYVWGYKSTTMAEDENGNSVQRIAPDMFNLADCASTSEGYMYAIGDNTFDMDNETALDDAGNANAKIKCLMPYGASVKGHVATGMKGQSVQYISADQAPAFWNYKTGYQAIKKTGYIGMQYDATKAGTETDFVSSGRVNSYKEMGLAYVQVEDPTPGVLPAYQWASIDPENAPDSVKGTDADWAEKAILTYLQARFPDFEQKDEKDHEDPNVDLNLRDRDDIEKQFQQNGGNGGNTGGKKDKGGLPVGALIGIIAGGVVVVGGGVTAVILVMNKKKKAVAAVEAPAEAPAEGTEEKKDEE